MDYLGLTPTTLDSIPTTVRLRSQVLPVLHEAQARDGWVSDAAMREIAAALRVTLNDLEGIATSFPEIRRSDPGQHLIRLCDGLSCRCAGADLVNAAVHRAIAASGVDVTIDLFPCFFVCANGPIVEVDGVLCGRVTIEELPALLAPIAESQ